MIELDESYCSVTDLSFKTFSFFRFNQIEKWYLFIFLPIILQGTLGENKRQYHDLNYLVDENVACSIDKKNKCCVLLGH